MGRSMGGYLIELDVDDVIDIYNDAAGGYLGS